MKVKELIEILKKCDPDAICKYDYDGGYSEIPITKVDYGFVDENNNPVVIFE